jgi:tetratricopeptide (TPR) repeat protein
MLKYKIIFAVLMFAIIPSAFSFSQEKTWRLEENQNWDVVQIDSRTKFLSDISDAQKTVDEDKTKAARKEFAVIKANYSDFSGPDLDLFIKAELLLSQKKLSKAARSYDNMLVKYPESTLSDLAIIRESRIGMAFLNGRKKMALGFVPISGSEEGIGILEKMIDHAGYVKQISVDASIAIAKNYEKRKKFNDAYLKWYEIYSLANKNDTINKDALLGMAKAKLAVYDRNKVSRRPFYDASCLRTAKTYFEMFQSSYPQEAENLNIGETLNTITEQLAQKELNTGLYYQRTGNKESANLYFDMVISDWPKSKSAEIASIMLNKNKGS